MNISRNPGEIDAGTDALYVTTFMTIGVISLPPNLLTIYLLAAHSTFYSTEMRLLLINLQVQSCLQNLHFCILFTPFIFPSLGGGYCNGLLCMLGLPFHYCFTLFLLSTVLICSAFIIIVFARHQTLVAADSLLKLGNRARRAFYILTHLIMLTIPALFLSMKSPQTLQDKYLAMNIYINFLTWRGRGINWSVIYLEPKDPLISILMWTLYVNIVLFGSIMVILLIHTIWIIARTYKLRSGRRLHGGWQSARIKNTIIVFIQLAIAILLLLAPFLGMLTTVGKSIQVQFILPVLRLEVVFSLYSLANAIFFIVCNKQYNLWLRTTLLRCHKKSNVQALVPGIELETTEEPRSPHTLRVSPGAFTLRPTSSFRLGAT